MQGVVEVQGVLEGVSQSGSNEMQGWKSLRINGTSIVGTALKHWT